MSAQTSANLNHHWEADTKGPRDDKDNTTAFRKILSRYTRQFIKHQRVSFLYSHTSLFVNKSTDPSHFDPVISYLNDPLRKVGKVMFIPTLMSL